ncbi:hypothetical protein EC9_27650 [Rosistilla ulvae]|uniref:Uncharacterized protein n=1 Tax=Rosistilla ulvae TaxID=1930277 RepID=A0A517M115_9BACT|nr:hypothetical protein EC9_27650 [Rosistilla ulvae]
MQVLSAPTATRRPISSLIEASRREIATGWSSEERAQRKAEAEQKFARLSELLFAAKKVL